MSFEGGAVRIRWACSGVRTRNYARTCRYDAPIQTSDGNVVARLHNPVLHFGIQHTVFLHDRINGRCRLDIWSMIDELLNGNAFGELEKAANVIAVIVSRTQMIDLLEAGLSDRPHDAIGVADCGRARITCVDENRL